MKRKVSAAFVFACVLVAAFAPVASAAKGTQDTLKAWQLPWDIWQQFFPSWPGWANKPDANTGLAYGLSYVPGTGELVLYVYNPTHRTVTVSQPTSQMVDFALVQSGRTLWKASADKSYAKVLTKDRIKPGEVKVYKETMPWLRSGFYLAQAYYLGESKVSPVASTYIRINAHESQPPQVLAEPVEYSVEYMAPTTANPNPRVKLTIKNISDKDITLPYQYGYQVLVKKVSDSDYLPNVGMGQSLGTIEKGATRYVFVNLAGIEPGNYEVHVRSNLSHLSWYRVVAQTWFHF